MTDAPVVRRGELWWADLGLPLGSRPAGERPVLVVSSDRFNSSNIRTVQVAAVSTNARLAGAPGNVVITADTDLVERDSVVNVSQLETLNKTDLVRCRGRLRKEVMDNVDAGLRLALDL